MENFSFYLTFKFEDFIYTTDSKLILNKKIPLQLHLDNYEEALTEFSSTSSLIQHRHYLNIEEIFPESLYHTLGYTNITIPIEYKNEGNIVNHALIKRLFFSFNRLYYNFPNIQKLNDNYVVIIFNFTANLCFISFNPSLKEKIKDLLQVF